MVIKTCNLLTLSRIPKPYTLVVRSTNDMSGVVVKHSMVDPVGMPNETAPEFSRFIDFQNLILTCRQNWIFIHVNASYTSAVSLNWYAFAYYIKNPYLISDIILEFKNVKHSFKFIMFYFLSYSSRIVMYHF